MNSAHFGGMQAMVRRSVPAFQALFADSKTMIDRGLTIILKNLLTRVVVPIFLVIQFVIKFYVIERIGFLKV